MKAKEHDFFEGGDMAFINRKNGPVKRSRSSVMQAIMQEDPYAVPVKRCKLTTQDSVPIEGLHEKLNEVEMFSSTLAYLSILQYSGFRIDTNDAMTRIYDGDREVAHFVISGTLDSGYLLYLQIVDNK